MMIFLPNFGTYQIIRRRFTQMQIKPAALLLALALISNSPSSHAEIVDGYEASVPSGGALDGQKPRIIVTTDIRPFDNTGEFDDKISMIDLLLYSDVFDIKGIFVNHLEPMEDIIDAYAIDYQNLKTYGNYPTAQYLRSIVGNNGGQEITQRIQQELNKSDTRPLWVLSWGGSSSDVGKILSINPNLAGKNWRYISVHIGSTPSQDFLDGYYSPTKPWWIMQLSEYRVFTDNCEINDIPGYCAGDFPEVHVRGMGSLGRLYFTIYDIPGRDIVHRAGDNSTFHYLLRGNPDDPSGEHWGGSYSNVTQPFHGSQFGSSINSTFWTSSTLSRNHLGASRRNPWGQLVTYNGHQSIVKYRLQYYGELASRYRRLKYPNGSDPSPIDPLRYTSSSSSTSSQSQNSDPVSSFTVSSNSIELGSTVNVNGTGSYDPDGSITEYRWNFGDGSGFTYTSTANHQYSSAGVYTIVLRVTDNSGERTVSTQTVTVTQASTPANQSPISRISISDSEIELGSTVNVNGTGSYDPDGSITEYRWNFGDGSGFTYTPTANHQYSSAGAYTIALRVTDNSGEGTVSTQTVTVAQASTPANQSPISRISISDSEIELGSTVNVNGTGSYDPDGSITEYRWNFGDGSGFIYTPTANHQYSSAGAYTIALRVTDNSGERTVSTQTVTVAQTSSSANQSPISRISISDTEIELGNTISVDATGSYDPDGSITEYRWKFGDDSGFIYTPTVNHTYSEPGEYTIALRVTDSNGDRRVTTRTVTVTQTNSISNQSPVSSISLSHNDITLGSSLTVDARQSYDPDGVITEYRWNFGDGSDFIYTPIANHIYSTVGEYTISLRVIDNNGELTVTSRTVTVSEPSSSANQSPVSSIIISQSEIELGNTLNVDATQSYDPDGSIISFRWNFGDGSNYVYTPTASHQYTGAGEYTIALRVTDNNGERTVTTRTVIVNEKSSTANQSPVSRISVSQTNIELGSTLTADGSQSYDPDGSIAQYRWDFGDGSGFSYEQTANHLYTSVGEYTISLRITDNNGERNVTTRAVTVTQQNSVANQSPIANFTANNESLRVREEISLNATSSYDPDGSVNSYNWDFGDGRSESGVTTEHTYQSAGNYRITLTVTDDKNSSSTTSKTVSVVEDTQVETSGNQEEESIDETPDELAIESGGVVNLYAFLLLIFSLGYRRVFRVPDSAR